MIVIETPEGDRLTCTPTAYMARYQGCQIVEMIPARSDRRMIRG